MNQTIEIAFLGCGNIGTGVWKLLSGFSSQILARKGLSFHVKHILVKNLQKKRNSDIPQEVFTEDFECILKDDSVHIVLEFLGGEYPAWQYMKSALEAGKTVVTANKVALSLHWKELHEAALQNGVGLYFEAAACGAIPIIRALHSSLQSNEISSLYGIVNGTTNYILTQMKLNGMSFAEALSEAQNLGYAEPNPSSDVDGLDAAYKLSLLASLAFCRHIPLEAIQVEGIRNLCADDIRLAGSIGYTIKLLALAKAEGEYCSARVYPALLPDSHPLSNVNGSMNAVFLHGHACDDMMFMGRGAGDLPTASAIVSDLISATTTGNFEYDTFLDETNAASAGGNMSDWKCGYYLRFAFTDSEEKRKIIELLRTNAIEVKFMKSNADLYGDQQVTLILTQKCRENQWNSVLNAWPERVPMLSWLRVEE